MNAGDRDLVDELQGLIAPAAGELVDQPDAAGFDAAATAWVPTPARCGARCSVESPATEAHFRASTH